jgi:nucleotide-binding universal stress UspA family protein
MADAVTTDPAVADARTEQIWVIGLDGSPDAEHALSWALEQARERARIEPVLLRGVGAWSVPLSAPIGIAGTSVLVEWSEVARGVSDQVATSIETVIDPGALEAQPVRIETDVVQGSPTRALLDASQHADRLIVGSRGRSGFKELVLGSVSRQCATHAAVPVVVVPRAAPTGPVARITLGFDGSSHADSAARWVLAQPEFRTSRIEAVGAFDLSPFEDPDMTRERFPDEVAEAEAEFHRGLDAVDPDRRMTRAFSLRGARRALADAYGGADLVVLGARGRGTVGAALLGSVSNWVLHHSPCALVIVPSEHR